MPVQDQFISMQEGPGRGVDGDLWDVKLDRGRQPLCCARICIVWSGRGLLPDSCGQVGSRMNYMYQQPEGRGPYTAGDWETLGCGLLLCQRQYSS